MGGRAQRREWALLLVKKVKVALFEGGLGIRVGGVPPQLRRTWGTCRGAEFMRRLHTGWCHELLGHTPRTMAFLHHGYLASHVELGSETSCGLAAAHSAPLQQAGPPLPTAVHPAEH